MASKNIVAKGTTYNGVESVTFPVSGGGDATFYEVSDTTAGASDVASGKYFYTSSGVKTEGTASGGSATLITKNITANGTYNASSDNADGYSSVTVSVSGGGSSNVIQGTFTTGSAAGASTFTIPYSGNGYPISFLAYVNGGVYNNTSGGDSNWNSLVQRYAIGQFLIVKQETNTTPTYSASSSLTQNLAAVSVIYKNSASDPTSFAYSGGLNIVSFNFNDAENTQNNVVRFKYNGTTISYYVSTGTGRGLAPNTTYAYIAVYSS